MAKLTETQRRTLIVIDQHTKAQANLEDWLTYSIRALLNGLQPSDIRTSDGRMSVVNTLERLLYRAERASATMASSYMTKVDRINAADAAAKTPGRSVAPRRPAAQVKVPVKVEPTPVKNDETFKALDDFIARLEAREREVKAKELEELQRKVEAQARRKLARAERAAMGDQAKAPRRRAVRTIGYRRVIHPEASHKTGVCGLCLVASQRMYFTPDLQPIHDRCHCTVVAATSDNDPGSDLNNLTLKVLYENSDGMTNFELKRARYKQADDGDFELAKFTKISDIKRETKRYHEVRRAYQPRARKLRRERAMRRQGLT